MNPSTLKFAYDVVNHVMSLHFPKEKRFISPNDATVENAPVLYNKLGQHIVRHYFAHHKEQINTFCAAISDLKKLSRHIFCCRADRMIDMSRHNDQTHEVFYNLCIKLTLLGIVALEKGIADATVSVVERINGLATVAFNRGNLDEMFDNMFNFAYDLLSLVFKWSGCVLELHLDLKRLAVNTNSVDYFSIYSSYFNQFLKRHGNTIMNKFRSAGSKLNHMTKEVFIFQVQDWCDAYYGKIDEFQTPATLVNLLDIFMNISLLAVGLLYTCSIRIAHESMVKLALSAAKNGILTIEKGKKLRIKSLSEF